MSRDADLAKWEAWRLRFLEFDRGTISVGAFCRRAGVSVATFYQWRRKLAQSPASAAGPVKAVAGKPTASAEVSRRSRKPLNFVPIEIAARAGIEVLLPGGVRVTVPCHDHGAIRTVMACLLNAATSARPEELAC